MSQSVWKKKLQKFAKLTKRENVTCSFQLVVWLRVGTSTTYPVWPDVEIESDQIFLQSLPKTTDHEQSPLKSNVFQSTLNSRVNLGDCWKKICHQEISKNRPIRSHNNCLLTITFLSLTSGHGEEGCFWSSEHSIVGPFH